jgi:hypothetical protein
MTYSRQWMEEIGSEDAHGRALWSLGKAVAFFENPGHLAMSTTLFKKALRASRIFIRPAPSLFAWWACMPTWINFPVTAMCAGSGKVLADRLFDQFKNHATDDWPWLENALNYANGKLPHALLLSGQRMQRNDMVDMGLVSLKWLLAIQTEDGHFVPIGSNGWYEKGGPRARFDQQPIEANAMVEACVKPLISPGISHGLTMRSCVSIGFSDTTTSTCRSMIPRPAAAGMG